MRLYVCAIALLALSCRTTLAAPTTTDATVDVLDFLIGDASTWPRTGSQFQHQVVRQDRREVCWVKYGRPEMFECWRWDDEWIYHAIDHALDGDTGESYRFTDGRWLPRRLPTTGTWTLDVPQNRIRWFTRSCLEVRGPQGIAVDAGPNLFPLRLRAWLEPARDAGSLGVRDVLVLAYASYPPGGEAGPPELFYFARGAGWYRWESPRGQSAFDVVGGPAPSLFPGCMGRQLEAEK